jgi:hypothetical protein
MQSAAPVASLLLAISTALGAKPSPEPTAAQQRRVLKPEDFNAIRDVDEPNISSEGTW